jgi:hypothetical protein
MRFVLSQAISVRIRLCQMRIRATGFRQ